MRTAKEYKAFYQSEAFKKECIYDGTDLGAVCTADAAVFKIWSPIAEKVTLHLYRDGQEPAFAHCPMKKQEKGVWTYRAEGGGHGLYYDFSLVIDGEERRSADPWARACSCNGNRSMVVDLRQTDPEGWDEDVSPETGEEQFIYEMHIKDFTYSASSGVPVEYRGKYKGFAMEGTTLAAPEKAGRECPTGVDYLVKLGVTHVQLLPVFDFGSVDEAGPDFQFNWGYDPLNYNVPEGSYSMDPHKGEVRIRELKELIQALHKKGIGVIMDVVYNHTHSLDSWFNRTMPFYFYRQYEDGTYSNGSDCGNDFASEREMAGKYILESVMYWAEEYHMDGFRFDLMGLLDTGLMNEIRRRLDERFGRGKILLYGEPWSAADSPMEGGAIPCKKDALHLLDSQIGVFCDNTRDAIKGHVFYEEVPGFVNGGKNLEQSILKGAAAWKKADKEFPVKAPSQIVTYVSAHDNLTLWDKLMVTLKPGKDFCVRDEEVVRACKMAAAIYFTCQGRIFFLGGEEGARTKEGDENSYRSSPEINAIDWKRIYEYEDLVRYYQGLIAFRRQMPGLTDKSENAAHRIFGQKIDREGGVQFLVDNGPSSQWEKLLIFYNQTDKIRELILPEGQWELLVDETDSFRWQRPEATEQNQKVPPISVRVYGKKYKLKRG